MGLSPSGQNSSLCSAEGRRQAETGISGLEGAGWGVRVLGKASEPSLPAEPAESPPPVPLALPPQPGQHGLPFGCCEYSCRGS